MSKTYTATFRMSTPKEMAQIFQDELNRTPKWRFLKRMILKRHIEFWRSHE